MTPERRKEIEDGLCGVEEECDLGCEETRECLEEIDKLNLELASPTKHTKGCPEKECGIYDPRIYSDECPHRAWSLIAAERLAEIDRLNELKELTASPAFMDCEECVIGADALKVELRKAREVAEAWFNKYHEYASGSADDNRLKYPGDETSALLKDKP